MNASAADNFGPHEGQNSDEGLCQGPNRFIPGIMSGGVLANDHDGGAANGQGPVLLQMSVEARELGVRPPAAPGRFHI